MRQASQHDFIFMHVDDSLIGGRKLQVEASSSNLLNQLRSKSQDSLKKHLGIWWRWKEYCQTREVYLRAIMPKMVQEIKNAYIEAISKPVKSIKTPGYPGKCPWKATEVVIEIKTTVPVESREASAVRGLVRQMINLLKTLIL